MTAVVLLVRAGSPVALVLERFGIGRNATAIALAREARAVAEGIQDVEQRARALLSVAVALAEAGKVAEAQAIAERIQGAGWRDAAFSTVAETLARAGKVAEAVDIARSIDDPRRRAVSLAEVAIALLERGP